MSIEPDGAPDHIAEIRKRLKAAARELAMELHGQKFHSEVPGGTLKFGNNNGSLRVETRGPKQGLWYDFAENIGGDALKLIQRANGGSEEDTIAWATNWLGMAAGPPPPEQDPARTAELERERELQTAETTARAAANDADKINIARWLWGQHVALADTIGEKYLNSRGIFAPDGGWPDWVAFLPSSAVTVPDPQWFGGNRRTLRPAVIIAATDDNGAVNAVQRIFLDQNGQNIREDNGAKIKRTSGVMRGAVVRLPGDPAGPLMLAEGPETGLSIWVASGFETHIALGSIANHEPPTGRVVVVCRDDDARYSPADHGLQRAVKNWLHAGLDIRITTPWSERRGDRSDFNDVLQAGGVEAIRARIARGIDPEPDHWPIRVPVTVARGAVGDATTGFLSAVAEYEAAHEMALTAAGDDFWSSASPFVRTLMNGPSRARRVLVGPGYKFMRPGTAAKFWQTAIKNCREKAGRHAKRRATEIAGPPPVHAINVDLGVGKSTAARRAVAIRLTEMRSRDDKRAVVFAVPTAKLGHEQVELFRALPEAAGLVARVRLGRERPDPETADHTMCRDLEAVRDAQAAMVSVQTSVCQSRGADGETTAECQFFSQCGYQRQRRQKADLWFVAHESLFLRKPLEIGEVAIVIVDEAPWHAGLIGHDGLHIQLSLDSIRQPCSIPDAAAETALLQGHRARLADLLGKHPDGPLTREAVLSAGFTVESTGEARVLEWRRKTDTNIWPGMPAKQRKDAAEAAAENRTIKRLDIMWRAVAALARDDGPAASGWAALTIAETAEGKVRVLGLKGRKEIREGWRRPTLLMDATLQMDLIRPFWSNVEKTADVLVQMPHQRVTQVVDRAYSKSHTSTPGNMEEIHAIVCREARAVAPGRALAVLQKDAEEDLKKRGNLPRNLETAHHNAVRGRDEWKDVAKLIVVGRTAPSPAAVERQAEALTGAAIPPIKDLYPQGKGWYPLTDTLWGLTGGKCRAAQVDRHPHPVAEAIRWSVTEAELIQIIGRARGADRTAANAVDVLVMCNTPLPMPVARLIAAADLAPSPADMMMAAGGVALAEPTHAVRSYPNLWPTPDAARKAFKRAEVADISVLIDSYRRMSATSVFYQFRLAGRGRRPARAVVDFDLIPDPHGWLESRLGPLSMFEADDVAPAARKVEKPTAVRTRLMSAATETEKFAPRAAQRLSPQYVEGCVPLVPGGYGDLLNFFPRMHPTGAGAVSCRIRIGGTSERRTVILDG